MEKYLKILGLKSGATEKEIKTAYRNLSKQYHPDLNPGDEEASNKMSEINEAYEILTGKSKPKQETPNTGGFSRGGGFGGPFGFGIRKAQYIKVVVRVTLEEVFTGVNKEINFNKTVVCGTCEGYGGKNPKVCQQCGGHGMYKDPHQTMGPNTMIMCHYCGGDGSIMSETCGTCHGHGLKHEQVKINVTIPKGVTGGNLILRNIGNEINNGEPGDVVCVIVLEKHPIFDVDGVDLHRSVDIKILDLLLGKSVEMDTLSGKVKITIPELTNPDKVFRIRGKGLVDNRHNTGDLFIKLNVVVPKEISEEIKDELRIINEKII